MTVMSKAPPTVAALAPSRPKPKAAKTLCSRPMPTVVPQCPSLVAASSHGMWRTSAKINSQVNSVGGPSEPPAAPHTRMPRSEAQDHRLSEGGDHVLGKQPHGFFGEVRCEVANPMSGAKDVVAGELALLLELAEDGVGAADEGQTVIDPKVVGLAAFLKHPTELLPLRRASLRGFEVWGSEANSRLGDELTSLYIAHQQVGLCLRTRLGIGLGDVDVARQEGMRHGAWMLVLLPESSVVGELLGD